MKSIKINSNDGYLNLTDLPHNCIFNKVITGCGGTTIALFNDENYVITVPTTELITNKTGLTSAGTAIIEKDGKQIEIFGLFGSFNYYTKQQLAQYLAKSGIKKIMCTYDKLEPLHKLYFNPMEYRLLVDEYQVLLKSYGYRKKAIDGVLNNFKKYKSYCFMSATPIDPEFKPDILNEAEEVVAEWEEVDTLRVILQQTNNPYTKVADTIRDYKKYGYITINDNIKSYEAFFFVNSVTDIAAILNHCKLKKEEVKIVCADTDDNREKLKGYDIENSKTPNKMFTFITSKSFEGADYYSETGLCFVLSNTSKTNTLLDIGTDIYQIAGRIRTKTNPFRDIIIHIYNTTGKRRNNLDLTYDEMVQITNKKLNGGRKLTALINEDDDLKESVEDYLNNNYINVDENGKYFVNDMLLKLELFIFRLEQSIYKNGISIAKTYRKNDMEPGEIQYEKLEKFKMERPKKPEFKEIFVRYADLKKQPFYLGDEIEYIDRQFPLVKQSYDLLGEDKVRNLKYIQKDIKAAITNLDHTKNQNTKIALILKDGLSMGWHSLKSLKGHIASAYKAVGLKETAKGSDIEKYFDCKECFRRVNGKNTQGYEIYRSKIAFVKGTVK